eukprot:9181060-Pyramimonas_sp.AAC.1
MGKFMNVSSSARMLVWPSFCADCVNEGLAHRACMRAKTGAIGRPCQQPVPCASTMYHSLVPKVEPTEQ